jgi:hypothetical protein
MERLIILIIVLTNNCFCQNSDLPQIGGVILHHSGDFCGVNQPEDLYTKEGLHKI